jgi:predicted MPP superfamily phosphohydrolase
MISRRQFVQLLGGIGASAAAAALYATVVEPWLRLVVTRYHVSPANWPKDLRLTIAVVADVHACRPFMSPERIRSIVETTNALNADLIVLLGDYVAGHHYVTSKVDSPEWAAALSGLKAPLGVHAILGNHDWWQDRTVQRTGIGPIDARRVLEAVGIPVYENDAVRIIKDGRAFWLAGLGDQLAFVPSRRRYPGRRLGADDLTATMAKVTGDGPVILLAHEPDIVAKVPPRVALTLSGHTHGGQVRLFGWSPVVPSHYGNRFAYGHIKDRCDLVVSGGLGCSIFPVRIGVAPEVVVVTLGEA